MLSHIDLLLQKIKTLNSKEAFEELVFPDVNVNVNIIIHRYVFPIMFPFKEQLDFILGVPNMSIQYLVQALAKMNRAVFIGKVEVDYIFVISKHMI